MEMYDDMCIDHTDMENATLLVTCASRLQSPKPMALTMTPTMKTTTLSENICPIQNKFDKGNAIHRFPVSWNALPPIVVVCPLTLAPVMLGPLTGKKPQRPVPRVLKFPVAHGGSHDRGEAEWNLSPGRERTARRPWVLRDSSSTLIFNRGQWNK